MSHIACSPLANVHWGIYCFIYFTSFFSSEAEEKEDFRTQARHNLKPVTCKTFQYRCVVQSYAKILMF